MFMALGKELERYSVVLNIEEVKELDDVAKKQERSRSFIIRKAVKEYCKKFRSEKNVVV